MKKKALATAILLFLNLHRQNGNFGQKKAKNLAFGGSCKCQHISGHDIVPQHVLSDVIITTRRDYSYIPHSGLLLRYLAPSERRSLV